MPNGSTLSELLDWLSHNGIALDDRLEIRHDSTTGFGVFFRGDIDDEAFIDNDEIVSVIPKTALLSKQTNAFPLVHELENLVAAAFPAHTSGTVLLACIVSYEILLEGKSRWGGYLKSLPDQESVGLPALWQDEEALEWLKGTDVLRLVQHQGTDKVLVPSQLKWQEYPADPRHT